MNKIQISNLLRYKTGLTVEAYAIANGYVKQTVHRAISGKLGNSPLYEMISESTGKPKNKLWPNKFNGKAMPEQAKEEME